MREPQLTQALLEIKDEIGALKGEVKTGFAGVHARQDKTNGNVTENRTRINTLEQQMAGLVVKVSAIVTVLVTVFTTILNKII